jgi:YVTN family beta-propeller protein
VYVVGKGAVVEVDPAVPAVTRRWALEFDPVNLVFDAERNRAFATPHLGLKVAELGLDDGKVRMSLTTGRTGTKVGKAIGLALLGTVERSGTVFTLGPEGRYLYVVNGQTDDLTLVDTTEHRVVETVATGGGTRGILVPEGGASVYVVSKDHLTRFDTATRKAAGEISTAAEGGPAGAVTLSPDGRWMFVPRGTKVEVRDAATGERLHTIPFSLPVSVVVPPGSGDGPPTPPAPAPGTSEG